MAPIDAEKKGQIQAHICAHALAALLEEETNPAQVKILTEIEAAVRGQ
ncbi:hypothetical protein [Leptolyngbya sp. 'hensonii']|nr:hypothetical protein [Leptolyngbya sp. 'hensonii']